MSGYRKPKITTYSGFYFKESATSGPPAIEESRRDPHPHGLKSEMFIVSVSAVCGILNPRNDELSGRRAAEDLASNIMKLITTSLGAWNDQPPSANKFTIHTRSHGIKTNEETPYIILGYTLVDEHGRDFPGPGCPVGSGIFYVSMTGDVDDETLLEGVRKILRKRQELHDQGKREYVERQDTLLAQQAELEANGQANSLID